MKNKGINTGGPAFPRSGFLSEMDNEIANKYDNKPDEGMTLRDYFAAKALVGMSAHKDSAKWEMHEIAADAYAYADAMIAARIKY